MRRPKKPKTSPSSSPFLFTMETMSIALKAVKRFEEPLRQVTDQDEKVIFARKVTQRVRAKLDKMRAEVIHRRSTLTTFDYNEKVALVAAVQMYSVELCVRPVYPRQAWELEQCRLIIAYFTLH